MENELEQRVWQRVAGSEPETVSLHGLIDQEEELANLYRHLAGADSVHRSVYQALHRSSREGAEILRGMRILGGGDRYTHNADTPLKEKSGHLLAKACRRCTELEHLYSSLSRSGEYACVFRCLDQRRSENLAALLGILGQ